MKALVKDILFSGIITFVLYEGLWYMLTHEKIFSDCVYWYLLDFCYCLLFVLTSYIINRALCRFSYFQDFTSRSQIVLFNLLLIFNNLAAYLFEFIYEKLVPADTLDLYHKSIFLFCILATLLTFSHYTGYCYRKILNQKHVLTDLQKRILKRNLDPHFVFNSLNTLTELIHRDQKQAEEYTIALSNIYRHILDNINDDYIPITQTINFIKAYIELQKYRVSGNISVNINVAASNADEYLFSMGLQTLVENAIKHNTPNDKETLEIDIYRDGDDIVVRNKTKEKSTEPVSFGLGLEILSKRYQIDGLAVPEITHKDGYFEARMPIIKRKRNEKNTNY